MKLDIANYKTLIFDCDGVVLNSNKIKTQAFYYAALPYGELAAKTLVNFHVNNGGVSRYKKFELFLNSMIEKESHGPNLNELLEAYAKMALKGLLECEIAKGLEQLRESTNRSNWLIVSGGDQAELRNVFAERGLSSYFDGGIFGSPDTKDDILAREIKNGNIHQPALFLGDSRYDHLAAKTAGVDFVFVSSWTEFAEWSRYCGDNQLAVTESLAALAN